MKALRQLQEPDAAFLGKVRDALSRNQMGNVSTQVFSKIVSVLRKFDPADFDEVCETLKRQNQHWLQQ